MSHAELQLATLDPVWQQIRDEAVRLAGKEPVMAGMLHSSVLNHPTLEASLSYVLAHRLGNADLPAMLLRQVFDEGFGSIKESAASIRADISAVTDRDPACHYALQPLLFFKGFQALQTHRIAHWLWDQGRTTMAFYLQSRSSEVFGVDINPAARIGCGVFMDHATGVVIGETAVVENDVSMLHGVNLGGTGKERGDRHPKIRQGVLLGAGCKILGNIEVGAYAKVAAGSVVLAPVRAGCTVAGVPARYVGLCGSEHPARDMDQRLPDEA